MSQDMRKWIHRIYGIALSAVTVITGIRFIAGCYGIYTAGKVAGGQIYSRAAVAEAFAPMALSTYLCLALVIAGFILHLALPQEKKKVVPEKNRQLILSRLQAKTDLAQCEAPLQTAILRQQKLRRLHITISAVLLVIFSAVFLVYACQPTRWPDVAQVTGMVVQAVFAMFGCLLLPTAYILFTAYFCRKSLDQEIELMKQAAAQAPRKAESPRSTPRMNLLVFFRYAILAIAITCIIIGYCNGGIADVVAKAAAICTECVGLG